MCQRKSIQLSLYNESTQHLHARKLGEEEQMNEEFAKEYLNSQLPTKSSPAYLKCSFHNMLEWSYPFLSTILYAHPTRNIQNRVDPETYPSSSTISLSFPMSFPPRPHFVSFFSALTRPLVFSRHFFNAFHLAIIGTLEARSVRGQVVGTIDIRVSKSFRTQQASACPSNSI
ncbi:hypothetical protein C8R48DRAFT_763841 [Suillus tomentosus]|nr:hypothetical protein C8R48DRAFT_763841 [Suillus tomentosus]